MIVSYCTTCHGRLWQLALTLHGNIGRLRYDEELVLVDYGSPDGLNRFIESSEICQQAIQQQKLVYVQTGSRRYHCPKAKNLAHRIARGKYLVNLDADNTNEGMREQIDKCYAGSESGIILHMDDQEQHGAFGRICIPKRWFYELGGYDESLLPSGYQDSDFIDRARAKGLEYVLARSSNIRPVQNTMLEKAISTGHQNWSNMKLANKETSERNIKSGRLVANPHGWAAAKVSINFGRVKMLPPVSGRKISLVLLNWSRPENVRRLLSLYGSMSLIGEIFVVNNNAVTAVQPSSEKVIAVNSGRDLGLFSRFAIASLASYPTIMIADDDLFIPEETISQLYQKWCDDPLILHGLVGRNTVGDNYSGEETYGPCEIVLTRALLTTPEACARALTLAPQFHADLGGYPKGNGEDILLSLMVLISNNRLNIAHSFPFEEWSGSDGIHHRHRGHFDHRSEVVKWCRENIVSGIYRRF